MTGKLEGWFGTAGEEERGWKVRENYRAVTLMGTLNKVYSMILERKLEKEMERVGMVREGQTGLRKGMDTMENSTMDVCNELFN